MNSGTERIIGDFLEINADMVYQRDKSKLPKFLSKIRYKMNNKKLLKRVEIFRNSNIYLTKNNILELFNHLQNSFDNKYDCILKASFSETTITIYSFDKYVVDGTVTFDHGNFLGIINIEPPNNRFMEIRIRYYDKGEKIVNNYNFSIEKFDNRFVLERLNFILKNFIADYIKSILDSYGGKNDKRDQEELFYPPC